MMSCFLRMGCQLEELELSVGRAPTEEWVGGDGKALITSSPFHSELSRNKLRGGWKNANISNLADVFSVMNVSMQI